MAATESTFKPSSTLNDDKIKAEQVQQMDHFVELNRPFPALQLPNKAKPNVPQPGNVCLRQFLGLAPLLCQLAQIGRRLYMPAQEWFGVHKTKKKFPIGNILGETALF
ncbi:hypothetical protein [Comamonas trifloxystrobinivorans]|uniref:hypothetical protein n=1 Tax=Comamonas trifloxystrobinivorans TaxID=3350256 RepID=UPI003D6639C0